MSACYLLFCVAAINLAELASPFPLSSLANPSTSLYGMFDSWKAGGSASEDDLEEQWRAQQEMLARRRGSGDMEKYFKKTEARRSEADKKQRDMWAWQKQGGSSGRNLLEEWKKRRGSGQISDLEDQYAEDDKKGGIQLPMASFGVGGEFGVGGKFDNGGRFDLRLPYAEAGYVDEDSDWLGRKKKASPKESKAQQKKRGATPPPTATKKTGFKFPWDK